MELTGISTSTLVRFKGLVPVMNILNSHSASDTCDSQSWREEVPRTDRALDDISMFKEFCDREQKGCRVSNRIIAYNSLVGKSCNVLMFILSQSFIRWEEYYTHPANKIRLSKRLACYEMKPIMCKVLESRNLI